MSQKVTIYGILSVVAGLSGCVFAPHYHPRTIDGVRCKQECSEAMMACAGSSYTCDRGYNNCINSCKDADYTRGEGKQP